MTDPKQSDKSFTYRLIQVLELNLVELNLLNGTVLGNLRHSLSSREVAKTRLRAEARKLEKVLTIPALYYFVALGRLNFWGC